MKFFKIFLLIFFITVGITSSQSRVVSTVPINISLVKGLGLNVIQNSLDFGEIITAPGTNNISRNASEGIIFEISGNPGKNVSISYSAAEPTNSTWAEIFGGEKSNLTFQPEVYISTAKNSTSLEKISNGSIVNLDKESDGKILVNIGGNLSLASNQPAGDYQGNISLTVSY